MRVEKPFTSRHWLIWSLEQNVPIHADRELVPSRDLDRWLHVEVAPGDLSASLAQFLADSTPGRLSGRWVRKRRLVGSLRNVECRSKQACEDCKADETAIVMVYLVSQPEIAVACERILSFSSESPSQRGARRWK